MTPILPQHAFCPARRLMAGLALGLLLSAGTPSDALAQSYNSEGWTRLQPSEDTRFVFVSSSEGNDANHGHSPAQPVRTIARAKQLMRDNNPDWMLLRRGDTWTESFGGWPISGRSESERVVVASYGESDARPRLLLTDTTGISAPYQQNTSFVAIVGIHFQADRPARSASRGIRWLSSGRDLLIEDCLIEGFKDNITIEGQGDGFKDATLRRNIIVDSWSSEGHSQGVYISNTTNVLIEENVVDKNGWNPDVPGAEANTFKQNIYVQTGVTGVVFRGNITSRAAAAGIQLRTGGLAENNLIYANPMGMRFGYPTEGNIATGEIRNNVILGGPLSRYESGFGIWTERMNNVNVTGNVVANAPAGEQNVIAFTMGGFSSNVVFEGNVVYRWETGSIGTALRSTSDDNSNTIFRHNVWAHGNPDSGVVAILHPDNIQFDQNMLINLPANVRAFRAGNDWMTLQSWNALPTVGTDQSQPYTFVDSERDLAAYARHIGLSDEASFLSAARQLSRRNWRPELTGAAASEWIRAGFALQPD